jgi:hypothetical protein
MKSTIIKTKNIKVYVANMCPSDKKRGHFNISTGNASLHLGLREARTVHAALNRFFNQATPSNIRVKITNNVQLQPTRPLRIYGYHGWPERLANRVTDAFPQGYWAQTLFEEAPYFVLPDGTTLDDIYKQWNDKFIVCPKDGYYIRIWVTHHKGWGAQ